MLSPLKSFLDTYGLQLLVTLGLFVLYLIIRKIWGRLITRHAVKNDIGDSRVLYVKKMISLGLFLCMLVFVSIVWEISLQGLSIYFASIFTVVGVGLFANWSILSNVTASVILFFFFPHKIGTQVRIIDGDNSIEGKITDISLFYVIIETKEGKTVSYPNNLAIQKAIMELS